jgi:hypothetical protein
MEVIVHTEAPRLTVRQAVQFLSSVAIVHDGLAVATGREDSDTIRNRLTEATDVYFAQRGFEQLERLGQSVLDENVWPRFNYTTDAIIQALLRISPEDDGPELVSVQQGSLIVSVVEDIIAEVEQTLRRFFPLVRNRLRERESLREPRLIQELISQANGLSQSQAVAAGLLTLATENMHQTLAQMQAREIAIEGEEQIEAQVSTSA